MKFTQILSARPATQFDATWSWRSVGICVVLSLAACGGSDAPAPTPEASVPTPEAVSNSESMPPGFTDAPPPPPSSNTLVLSGGVLLLDTPITDSVVVITDGKILAWGRRGEVDMPNDSIGLDMRGKWLRAASSLNSGSLTSGQTADFQAFDQFPADQTIVPIGTVVGQEVSMPAAE